MGVGDMVAGDNIIRPSPGRNGEWMSERKWGKDVMALGFSIVPSLLLRAQQRLGLNPTQLSILMQLCDFWWDEERKPFPSKATLSDRLGLSARQIQRHIAELEGAGLVQRTQRWSGHGGKTTNSYDLSGLVGRLQQLEPEFREVEERAKADRKAVSRPKRQRGRSANERESA